MEGTETSGSSVASSKFLFDSKTLVLLSILKPIKETDYHYCTMFKNLLQKHRSCGASTDCNGGRVQEPDANRYTLSEVI